MISQIPASGSRDPGPRLWVPDSGSRTPGPGPRVPNPRSRIPESTCRFSINKIKPRVDICQILPIHVLNLVHIRVFSNTSNRGFRFLHLGPGIRVPDPGTRTPGPGLRVPDSRIHLSMLGRNQGLKNYTNLFRLWTFFGSDLIDVNHFGMSCTFLVYLHWCIFEVCFFLKLVLS